MLCSHRHRVPGSACVFNERQLREVSENHPGVIPETRGLKPDVHLTVALGRHGFVSLSKPPGPPDNSRTIALWRNRTAEKLWQTLTIQQNNAAAADIPRPPRPF